MCLAIPGHVLAVEGDDPAFLRGTVNFGGIARQVSLAYTPEVRPGEYVLVHAGFSVRVVHEQEAKRSLQSLEELLTDLGEEGRDSEVVREMRSHCSPETPRVQDDETVQTVSSYRFATDGLAAEFS